MVRTPLEKAFTCDTDIGFGMTRLLVNKGIEYVYETLDKLDATLLEAGSPRMTGLVELANLSSIIGNLLATGIVKAGADVYGRAGPHKYQDLRAINLKDHRNAEIKVALEDNKPKGHLPKEGYYLTCRYVLGDQHGKYVKGKENRGDVVWIWEVRFGCLELKHFNVSNTAGDSGKTAVVNAEGMGALKVVYYDQRFSPHGPDSKYARAVPSAKPLPLLKDSMSDRAS
jgi:hypothetical protein